VPAVSRGWCWLRIRLITQEHGDVIEELVESRAVVAAALDADLVHGGVHVAQPAMGGARGDGEAGVARTQRRVALARRVQRRATEALDQELVLVLDGAGLGDGLEHGRELGVVVGVDARVEGRSERDDLVVPEPLVDVELVDEEAALHLVVASRATAYGGQGKQAGR